MLNSISLPFNRYVPSNEGNCSFYIKFKQFLNQLSSELFFKSFDPSLPVPIAFNGWKHHLLLIRSALIAVGENSTLKKSLFQQLENINGSVLDVYDGKLSCCSISNEIISFLEEHQLNDEKIFREWLNSFPGKFASCSLSDGSSWTLTWGRFPQQFVHIHPSRYSPHSLRIKPTTLKTAIAYSAIFDTNSYPINTEKLNRVRQDFLQLSPVKKVVADSSTYKLIEKIAIF